MDHHFESDEEMYMYWYIEELLKHNIIISYEYQPKAFLITPQVNFQYKKQLKTKVNTVTYCFIKESTYTADFKIYWNPQYDLLFFGSIDNQSYPKQLLKHVPFAVKWSTKKQLPYSVIDVKGTYNMHDILRRFMLLQKLVYDKYGIYVQKIVPIPAVFSKNKLNPASALFNTTFTPKRYLTQNKTNKPRMIKFPHISLLEYLNQRKKLFNT